MISIIHKECQGLPYLELIEEDKKDQSLPLIVFYLPQLTPNKAILDTLYE